MNSTFELKEFDFKKFLNEFDDVEFKFLEASISEAKLQAFYFHFETESELNLYWLQLINFLTGEFLVKQARSFERRNTYALYSCGEFIPKSLHYNIENNKFSVRKLVYKKITCVLNDKELISYLNEKILSSNIDIDIVASNVKEIELSEFSQQLIDKYSSGNNTINEEKFINDFLNKEIKGTKNEN